MPNPKTRLRRPSSSLLSKFALKSRIPRLWGRCQNGTRRIVNILGGTFEGPKLKGKVVPGGADWQIIRKDGFTEVDARYTLQTDSGRLIYVSNIGMRHAAPEVIKRLNAGEQVNPADVVLSIGSEI
jgi:hypothetical protein